MRQMFKWFFGRNISDFFPLFGVKLYLSKTKKIIWEIKYLSFKALNQILPFAKVIMMFLRFWSSTSLFYKFFSWCSLFLGSLSCLEMLKYKLFQKITTLDSTFLRSAIILTLVFIHLSRWFISSKSQPLQLLFVWMLFWFVFLWEICFFAIKSLLWHGCKNVSNM